MSDFVITDARGQDLILRCGHFGYRGFDAVAFSPVGGFTPLWAEVDWRPLAEACRAAISRNEVCVLPREAHPAFRVLLTPSIYSEAPVSRGMAERRMLDLFYASQSGDVASERLLITHFGRVHRLRPAHVDGILDAIDGLSRQSFGRLTCLAFLAFKHQHAIEAACARIARPC
jgi:hypothetical protein